MTGSPAILSRATLHLVRREARIPGLLLGVAGLALLIVGVMYLTVECQALPGFLGPTHGDTSPRTKLGIVGVIFGLAVLIGTFVLARRRPPV
jgi:hypothetical protein